MSTTQGQDMKVLGAAMRRIRHERKLTLQYMEKHTGLNTGNLSRIERGQQGVSIDSLRRIATALGVNPTDLFAHAGSESADFRAETGRPTFTVPKYRLFEFIGHTSVAEVHTKERAYVQSPTATTFAVDLTAVPGFDRLPRIMSNVLAVCDAAPKPKQYDVVVCSVGHGVCVGEYRDDGVRRYVIPLDGLPPHELTAGDRVLGVVQRIVHMQADAR